MTDSEKRVPTRTYVRVVLVEATIIVLLWILGRVFS
jgi:hypothetical protein